MTSLSPSHHHEIERQVAQFLGRSTDFQKLPRDQPVDVHRDKESVVKQLAHGPRAYGDPYAVGLAEGVSPMNADVGVQAVKAQKGTIGVGGTGNTQKLMKDQLGKFGDSIGVGVTQAA